MAAAACARSRSQGAGVEGRGRKNGGVNATEVRNGDLLLEFGARPLHQQGRQLYPKSVVCLHFERGNICSEQLYASCGSLAGPPANLLLSILLFFLFQLPKWGGLPHIRFS